MDGWRLTADEHGILDVAALRRAGLDSHAVTKLVGTHQLTPLARSWYVCGSISDPEALHILTTRAMLRSHGDRAVAGHHSALLLLGLPIYRADLSTVRLSRRTPGPTRTRRGLKLGRAVPMEAQDHETVVAALAVVQHGISAGPLSALVAADAALRRKLVTRDGLDLAMTWIARQHQSALVGDFIDLADGRRESPGETRLAHLFHLMRVPVTPQFEISAGDFRAVADFRVDGEMVVVEFDGKVKYGRSADEPDPYGHRRPVNDVVWEEKRREDRIRELGYEVVRVVWSDLEDPVALGKRIAAAIRRARARHGPPDSKSGHLALG